METIKFKKSDWIVVAIVIVLIIAIAIVAFSASKKEDESDTKEKEKKNRLIRCIQRWQELIDQISIEIKTLKLTQEMEAMLERKITTYLILAKIAFVMVFIAVVGLFYSTGIDIVTAAINTTGILTIFFFGGSILFLTKFTDPNSVVESFVQWVRNTVYKKYGYDPALIPAIKESIVLKQNEVVELNAFIQKD
jgi:hypothetical protein